MKKIILIFIILSLLFNTMFFVIWFTHGFTKYYNNWNTSYQSGNINTALTSYSGALNISPNNFDVLHNIGNSYYKIATNFSLEKFAENSTREEFEKIAELVATAAVSWNENIIPIYFYKKSIQYYEFALEIEQDPQTQKNLEFVSAQLQDKKQEQTSEQEWGENSEGSEQGNHEQNSGQDTTPSQPPSSREIDQTSQSEESPGGASQKTDLSQQTQEILEQRAQQLEQAQAELQKYYQQNHSPSTSQSLFDRVFNNTRLQDSDEKDW